MVLWRVVQHEPASQVEAAQVLEGCEQPGACRLGAGAAQGLDQHLGRSKALQRGGRNLGLPLRAGQGECLADQGWPIDRSLGNTCVTITPALDVPRFLMNPDEALFERVTTCAEEPAERSALMPSTTAIPAANHSTACASAALTADTMAA